MLPVRVGKHEVVQQVGERLPGDGHAAGLAAFPIGPTTTTALLFLAAARSQEAAGDFSMFDWIALQIARLLHPKPIFHFTSRL